MILYLYGNDTDTITARSNDMIAKFVRERDPQQMNVVKITVDSGTAPSTILAEVNASPFLAEKRFVLVKNPVSAGSAELIESLTELVQKETLPESTILLITESALPKKLTKGPKALHDALAKTKFAQEFAAASGKDLGTWIQRQLQTKEITIDRDALIALTDACNSQTEASQYVDQLASYVADAKHITLAEVNTCVPGSSTDDLFGLIDAVMARRGNVAFEKLYKQYESGTEAGQIVAMLIKQARMLVAVRDAIDRGHTDQKAIASSLGLHPFVVKKLFATARNTSLDQAKQMHAELLALDKGLKTGSADIESLLDLHLGKILTK